MDKLRGIALAAAGVLALVFAAGGPVCAAGQGKLGDPAPPLQVKEWVKGGAVDLAQGQGSKLYVVEFWATWCPPCRESVPHLTELQKKYKDSTVFVGVSTEDVDTVKTFVEKMGEKMDYHVAVDDQDKTTAAYMEAYNQNGIPHAFVIDKDGKVAWHGHPMDPEMTAKLDQLAKDLKPAATPVAPAAPKT